MLPVAPLGVRTVFAPSLCTSGLISLPRKDLPMFLNWLRPWISSSALSVRSCRAPANRRRHEGARLTVELLEDRRLLSGFAVRAGGVLADAGHAIAADFRGNVYVAGRLQQTMDVTGAPNLSGAF